MKTALLIISISIFLLAGCSTQPDQPESKEPDVAMGEVTNIYTNHAVASGKITALRGQDITDHGFIWARQSAPTAGDHHLSLGPTAKTGSFQGTLEDLAPNTAYYVRPFVAPEGDHVLYGNEISFKTLDVNSWVEKTQFMGGYLTEAASFVVNNTLYVVTGIHDTYTDVFYKYDYHQDTWKMVSVVPFEARANTISFSIGDYGYVGFGKNCTGSGACTTNYFADLWRYDPQDNRWTQMADFPGTARAFSTAFVIGDKAYVTGGSSVVDNDLWEYDPATDNWTQKADYPGGCSSRGISFAIDDKGYVGLGWGGFSVQTCDDLWEYDPANDSWTQKASLAGKARYDAAAFTLNGKGFVISGVKQEDYEREYLTDMWSYHPTDNTWAQIPTDYEGTGRVGMIAEVTENKIILGLGADDVSGGPYNRFDDIWEYIPEEGY